MTARVDGRQREAARVRVGAANAAVWLAALACGALASRAPVLGMRPLGLALAAAAPGALAVPACLGAALGSAAGAAFETSAPYLAALGAAAAARAASDRRRDRGSRAAAALGAVCYALCASGTALLTGAGAQGVLLAAAEAMIAAGASVLLGAFFSLRGRCVSENDSAAAAASLFALGAAVAALVPLRAGWLSAGLVFGSAAALAASLRDDGRGAAAGVAVCAALAAADASLLFAGLGVAAGALAAGLCRDISRTAAAGAFVLAAALGAACAPSAGSALGLAVQTGAAALLVLWLPARVWRAFPVPAHPSPRAASLGASEQIDAVARALCRVGETLESVCARMPRGREDMDDVCEAAVERVCASCRRRAACWTRSSPDAFDAMTALTVKLRRAGSVSAADLPPAFRTACAAPERLCAAVTGAYQAQIARRGEAVRADAARAALVEQYGAMAAALANLASDFGGGHRPDARRAARLEELFTELGAPPLETSVSAGADGDVTAVVRLPRMEFTPRELRELTAEASAVCRCPFETARTRAAGEQTMLTLRRRRLLTVSVGCVSRAAGDVSADVFRTAEDGRGTFHAVLCDGMGTGCAAAAGGTLAAELFEPLLCAGTGPEAAARLVGIALALKDGGEEPVAADVLSVDLYTGAARLYKAGGAPSFLIRDGEAVRIGGDSLPLGSSGRVTGRLESVALRAGDRLLMVSDGACAPGGDALCALLCRAADLGAQELCEAVAAAARKASDRPDDVTAACIELTAAV